MSETSLRSYRPKRKFVVTAEPPPREVASGPEAISVVQKQAALRAGLEQALAALWPDIPAQRCTVHKHGNLLAHASKPLRGPANSRLQNALRRQGESASL